MAKKRVSKIKRKLSTRFKRKSGGQPKTAPDWKPIFLEAIFEGNTVVEASRLAGVSWQNVYHVRDSDPQFAIAWAKAADIGDEEMLYAGKRRAARGMMKAVYYRGKIVGYTRDYSDSILLAWLKRKYPDEFGNGTFQLTGKDGGPIQWTNLTDEQLVSQLAELDARIATLAAATPPADGRAPAANDIGATKADRAGEAETEALASTAGPAIPGPGQ